jgi:hypothetical protein
MMPPMPHAGHYHAIDDYFRAIAEPPGFRHIDIFD